MLSGGEWLTGFEEAQRTAAEIAAELLQEEVTPEALESLTDKLLVHLALADLFPTGARRYICRSTPVRPNAAEPADDPLNSFILDDLAKVAGSVAAGEGSAPLNAYLSKHDNAKRVDVSEDASTPAQCSLLAIERYPAGCWPTPGDLGLVHSQQLAVNAIREGLARSQGLLSVNGPPGTGKTTLLRDIVASVVTDRAEALAKLARPSDAFLARGTVVDTDKNRGYWPLHPDLLGHEIVVASSNNGAIENVTLELPQYNKVDPSWLEEYDLYADIASTVSGQQAWGLISGALGSKSRRSAFANAFWNGVAKPKPKSGDGTSEAGAEPAQPVEVNDDLPHHEVNPSLADVAEGDAADPSLTDPSQPQSEQAAATPADSLPVAELPEGEKEKPRGMEAWLNEQRKDLSAAEKTALWKQAVQRYQDAKREATQATRDARLITALLQERYDAYSKLPELKQAVEKLTASAKGLVDELATKDKETGAAEALLEQSLAAVAGLLKRRPGFWANLVSLGRAGRRWAQEEQHASAQRELAQGRCRRLEREMQTLRREIERQHRARTDAKKDRDDAFLKARRLTSEAVELASRYGAHYLRVYIETGVIGRDDAIELAEPWNIPGWRRAKAKVFLEAMRLHQTLFQLEPTKVFTNLTFAKVVLEGERYRNLPRDAARSVWGTLFMAVPVLSSTFSSFARCFNTLGAGDIGWLLVDEAGQATPQAAVGALWRSSRAVMVGDPLQLEPILPVPPAALEHMRRAFGVDAHWMPHQLSAQRLADMANTIGKEAGPDGDKVWVGLPLVVHRRCDRPMFKVANHIAYSNEMVYGTSARVPDTPATLPTGWVQVRGTSSGNWVPSEGRWLNLLLSLLTLEGVPPKDISVITPFGDVIRQVRRSPFAKQGVTFGTIHTMQGKEADVVVLVLGGNADPQRRGARDWVVAKPNMLNVAVTRAKCRLYVIGDRADWEKRRYFDQVMKLLPLINVGAALARVEENQQAIQGRSSSEQAAGRQPTLVLSDRIRIGPES